MKACALVAALALALGCGSRTGLGVEAYDAGSARDAGSDAGSDAGLDAGTDAGVDAGLVCRPGVVRLEQGIAEVVFVVDRSGSMAFGFDGLPAGRGESRWEILERALGAALEAFDERVSVGAKFFPTQTMRATEGPCDVLEGLDVDVGPGRAPGILTQFRRYTPFGGTPVGPATRVALDALLARADERRSQFIVIATDGAPTCGGSAVREVVEAVRAARDDHGIDVYVVGISSAPGEVDLLNQLAISGGRPRPSTEARRFYDARDPELLGTLLGEIARDLARCVFAVPVPPREDDVVEVSVGGMTVPHDPTRESGWDWTGPGRAQISLFGAACDRATGGAAVRANIACAEP
ncbi:MAG: VWA domain-containing protein [Sandaracinaceae bacterium]|nr:VWA domain-containing protein [Sandaracinaceae bacterium]